MNTLKLALPKGSLEESTFALFKKAGFEIRNSSRSFTPSVNDPELEIILFRPQEMSRYIEDGIVDCGLTGHDWIVENSSKVTELCQLQYSKQTSNPVRWVLAVHESSKVQSIKDLQGKKIVTELVNVTKAYLKKNKVKAEVEFSWAPIHLSSIFRSFLLIFFPNSSLFLSRNLCACFVSVPLFFFSDICSLFLENYTAVLFLSPFSVSALPLPPTRFLSFSRSSVFFRIFSHHHVFVVFSLLL